MAIATFNIFCVPKAKQITLDRIPLMIYFLKPKTLQIATASGADNWNSMPGMILGILIEPNIEIMATKIAISQSVEVYISYRQPFYNFS